MPPLSIGGPSLPPTDGEHLLLVLLCSFTSKSPDDEFFVNLSSPPIFSLPIILALLPDVTAFRVQERAGGR